MKKLVVHQFLRTDSFKPQRFRTQIQFLIGKQRIIHHRILLMHQQLRLIFFSGRTNLRNFNNCRVVVGRFAQIVKMNIMVFYIIIMKVLLSLVLVISVFHFGCIATAPSWTSIPSIRAGQIDSVTNLMTAEDTNTNLTDSTAIFSTISGPTNSSQLQYGLSLISYESWMTDTFSFNITLVNLELSQITVRFTVLDNTFFTQAKVHYLIIWRGATSYNTALPTARINIEVIYGCYLTELLLTNNNRTQVVGGKQTSSIGAITNSTDLFDGLMIKSMIAGIKMSNSVGNNDHITITPYINRNDSYLYYKVEAQTNNLITFFCVSTVIADPKVITKSYKYNLEYKTYSLNATNVGLADIPYSARYDGADRMFFGLSSFNLSMSDTRYLSVETANISLVSMLYSANAALNQVTYHTIFFAVQTCAASTLYDPVNYDCVATSADCVRSKNIPIIDVCVPCHYSCLTCDAGDDRNHCTSCPSNAHRHFAINACPCDNGYADGGVQICQLCSVTMSGCSQCLSTKNCTTCDSSNNFTESITNITGYYIKTCVCDVNFTLTTGYCLPYPGCLVAGYYNNLIACKSCDASKNFTMTSNFTCQCYQGFNLINNTCIDTCGNNETGFGRCDDGNNITGDGCDEHCNIQNGYVCPFNRSNITGKPLRSYCVLKQDLTVSYLYAQRYIGTNSFKMAFQVTPAQSGLTSTSFDKNFNTTLPIASQKIYCDPVANIIYLQGTYLQDLEGTAQTASISFNNMSFYADSQTIPFTAAGINAQLVLDQYASSNTIIGYIVMAEAFIALIVAIFASVVGLKLVGIELLIPIQLIYFTQSTISQQRSYNFVLNNFKYSNGFNTLAPYSYARTYSQSKSLVSMNYETQFLLSTNIMLVIFVLVLIWLLIHHLRLKYKEYKLESFLEANSIQAPLPSYQKQNSVDSEEDRENEDDENVKLKKKKKSSANTELQKQESKLREDHHRSFKVFSFEVDRVYFIFYLILINQMMFAFIIMTLNVPISSFYYPQEINVLACNFIFFIFIGNIVFISYDQQSNKMIAFTCIKDRYAYIYILINFIVITALSMSFQESFSGYMMAALTLAFPLLVLKQKPYGSVLLSLENVVALYLQIMLFVCEVIICLIQTSSNQKTSLVYSFLIMGLVAIGEILTIIRVAIKVNFKKAFDDLKNPHKDEDLDKKNKKVIEKNLDLLQEDKNINIIPPESVKNDLIPKNKMVDWQSKNTEEYESIRQREYDEPGEEGNQLDQEDEASENKEVKLNELQILKKRLRNNLKLKKEQDMLKKGI